MRISQGVLPHTSLMPSRTGTCAGVTFTPLASMSGLVVVVVWAKVAEVPMPMAIIAIAKIFFIILKKGFVGLKSK